MSRYVDGFVFPIPIKNLAIYKEMTAEAGKVWMKYGALEYVECVGDDLATDMGEFKVATFLEMTKAQPDEAVIFAFIVYKSKAHRDEVTEKVMADPEMNNPRNKDRPVPFDMKRMMYGGFSSIVDLGK